VPVATLGHWHEGPVLVAMVERKCSPVATDVTDARCYCEFELAMGERCSQLPATTVSLKLLYFFTSEQSLGSY
jgi:hypothetical protein